MIISGLEKLMKKCQDLCGKVSFLKELRTVYLERSFYIDRLKPIMLSEILKYTFSVKVNSDSISCNK